MLDRFLYLWCVLHVILLVVEIIRYKHSNTALKFKYYLKNRLLDITYFVYGLDKIGCVFFIGYICFNYITNGVLL